MPSRVTSRAGQRAWQQAGQRAWQQAGQPAWRALGPSQGPAAGGPAGQLGSGAPLQLALHAVYPGMQVGDAGVGARKKQPGAHKLQLKACRCGAPHRQDSLVGHVRQPHEVGTAERLGLDAHTFGLVVGRRHESAGDGIGDGLDE